jgi:hypothetical protein
VSKSQRKTIQKSYIFDRTLETHKIKKEIEKKDLEIVGLLISKKIRYAIAMLMKIKAISKCADQYINVPHSQQIDGIKIS